MKKEIEIIEGNEVSIEGFSKLTLINIAINKDRFLNGMEEKWLRENGNLDGFGKIAKFVGEYLDQDNA